MYHFGVSQLQSGYCVFKSSYMKVVIKRVFGAFMKIYVTLFMVKEIVFISIGSNDNAIAPDVEAVKS